MDIILDRQSMQTAIWYVRRMGIIANENAMINQTEQNHKKDVKR